MGFATDQFSCSDREPSHTQSMDIDEDSDQNLDLKPQLEWS